MPAMTFGTSKHYISVNILGVYLFETLGYYNSLVLSFSMHCLNAHVYSMNETIHPKVNFTALVD